MPASPLHFLAVASLYFRIPEKFDIIALLVSSTFVDFELLYYLLAENHMRHGFWHSYFFVLTIYPIVLSLIVFLVNKKLDRLILRFFSFFRFSPKKVCYSLRTVYFSCAIGGVSHIFFDMWTHEYSPYVLFPLVGKNPFWMGDWSIIVFTLIALLSVYSIILWIKGIQIHRKTFG